MRQDHSISDAALARRWDEMDWKAIEECVAAMQASVSEASRDGDQELLADLSERFLGSFDAKALAVRNVTKNEATENPGVGEPWKTSADKMKAVVVLDHHGYSSEPFYSFVMFEPKTKKDRTMCIPTFYDRAMHDLYRMLMEAVCEPLYDRRLFSSRTGRSLTDAAMEVKHLFSDRESPEWVARCDVKSFYDTMSHEWLLEHVPMDRRILSEFLKAPRVENGTGKPTVPDRGVPTGNRMSPVLANMMLNGLESYLRDPSDPDNGAVVRWVDDIVVSARTEEDALRFMALVKKFVAERGMRLNEGKSYVANVRDGFEFLKYRYVREGGSIHLTPEDSAVDELIGSIRDAVSKQTDEASMIKAVNSRIRGFTNKYRVSDMSGCIERIDCTVVQMVAEKAAGILHVPYESIANSRISKDDRGWVYGTDSGLHVRRTADIVLTDDERIWLTANPFIDRAYFDERKKRDQVSRVATDALREIWRSSNGCCRLCGMRIRSSEPRTVVSDEAGERGYVHMECKAEHEALHGRIRFLSPPEHCVAPQSSGPEPADEVFPEPVTVVAEEEATVAEVPTAPDVADEPVGAHDPGTGGAEPRPEQATLVPERKKIVIVPCKKGVSKFQPLVDFLNNIPYAYYDFTFEGLENLLIGGLCDSAYRDRSWWMRDSRATVGNALKYTDWGVEDVKLEKQWVRFSRNAKVKLAPPEIAYKERNTGPKSEAAIAERDARMEKSPFGRVTKYLMGSGLDQVRLTFDRVAEISRLPLPEWSKDKRWWSNRKRNSILLAIEDADFTKVDLDMDGRSILVVRTCCIPDESRDTVVLGDLPVKDYLRPKKGQ